MLAASVLALPAHHASVSWLVPHTPAFVCAPSQKSVFCALPAVERTPIEPAA